MEIEKFVWKQFRGLGLKHMPTLVFDGRWKSFSEYGLSIKGRFAYKLDLIRQTGVIKVAKRKYIKFSWRELDKVHDNHKEGGEQ